MKRVYWKNGYITVFPKNIEANPHKHYMLQLFIKKDHALDMKIENETITGKYILVASNRTHELKAFSKVDLFMLFDETSLIAEELKRKYLRGQSACSVPLDNLDEEIVKFLEQPNELNYNRYETSFFNELLIQHWEYNMYDERIKQVIQLLDESQINNESVEAIAKSIQLSSSYLSHLFKEEIGVPLKSYMLLVKLRKAYYYLASGFNITDTAQLAGFYSSSHLADVNKKMMGMSMSNAKEYFSL
ncbi:AraC family transcriptional regulator [Vallitalea longa]|uniref:AraC family transcriptional regulator n=1 Tax=Vallitalea longa TaxID=2936439 RepID=A0A9W5Y7V5_9FIRM|nr:response regulator transcription factor [Vallitalea longa]GKX28675.1 AraC family transcriptional regulator [Vallitalea longa]